MDKNLKALSFCSFWKARSASVAVAAALLAVVAVDSAIGQVNHNSNPGASISDCSTARADKIAAAETRKKRVEKMIQILDENIAEDSKRIPLTPNQGVVPSRTIEKLERSLAREKQERRERERDLQAAQADLAMASCY
jgi:septal ring factor EnvC (AmiA/AmiB activator)